MPLTPTAWGGWAAALVSAALLVVALVRDVGLNFGNGWTIVLGADGGTLAIVATSWSSGSSPRCSSSWPW